MRGIVLALIFTVLAPYSFLDTRVGILAWLWVALMNPHKYVWGFFRRFPFAQLVAIPTIAGFFLSKKPKKFPVQRETILILILWTIFTLTSITAIQPDEAWRRWLEVSKILFMLLLSVCIEWDRRWIYYQTLVLGFSVGLIGAKGGVWGLRTGGANMVLGPEGSFLEANTAIAVALNMSLPLLLIIARDEQTSRRLKMICHITVVLSGLSSLLTYSRGGLLGLLVVGGLLLIKSRYKILAVPLSAIALMFVLSFLPPEWFGKMGTIENYQQERSAMSRVVTWKVLWQFALDHPITGGGFKLYSYQVFDTYLHKALPPEQAAQWEGAWWDSHSIWFSMLAEHGFIGLFFYVSLFVSVFMSLRRLKRIARMHPPLRWMENYGTLLSVSLCGFYVSGSFLDFAYFDMMFQVIGLVVILKNVAAKELAATVVKEVPKGYPVFSPAVSNTTIRI